MIANEELDQLAKNTNKKSPEKQKQGQKKEEASAAKKKPSKQAEVATTEPQKIKDIIIDLEQLSKKNEAVENSDVLLSLYEITENSDHYGIKTSNKSRLFWNQLTEVKCFNKVLEAFKSETLRKYWRTLSEISTHEKVISIINKHKESINNTSLKLLTIITTIKDYLSGKFHDLEKHLIEAPDRNVKPAGKKDNDSEDESFKVEQTKKAQAVLSKKRAKDDKKNEDKPQAAEDGAKKTLFNITTGGNSNINNSKAAEVNDNNIELSKRALRPRTIANTSLFSVNDKSLFAQIETTVQTFKNNFPELNDDDIWYALKKTSFNIIDTYHYLVDPEQYEALAFEDEDDFIIKNLSKSKYYKKLVENKGKERVEEREIFLDIELNN